MNHSYTCTNDVAIFFESLQPQLDQVFVAIDQLQQQRRQFARQLAENGSLELEVRQNEAGRALLGYGWSLEEEWGVWNDGDQASLWLPIPEPGCWQVTLIGHQIASKRAPNEQPAVIEWSLDRAGVYCCHEVPVDQLFHLQLDLKTMQPNPMLHLRLPGSIRLTDEGYGEDPRQVAFGLRQILVRRSAVPRSGTASSSFSARHDNRLH